jgi:hypothetical protein
MYPLAFVGMALSLITPPCAVPSTGLSVKNNSNTVLSEHYNLFFKQTDGVYTHATENLVPK